MTQIQGKVVSRNFGIVLGSGAVLLAENLAAVAMYYQRIVNQVTSLSSQVSLERATFRVGSGEQARAAKEGGIGSSRINEINRSYLSRQSMT